MPFGPKKKESHSTLPSYQVLAYFCSLSRIIPLYDRIRTIATLSRCRYSRYYHIIPYHIYLSAIYYLHHCLSVIAVIILSATAVAHCLIHYIALPTGIYLPIHLPTYIHTYLTLSMVFSILHTACTTSTKPKEHCPPSPGQLNHIAIWKGCQQ